MRKNLPVTLVETQLEEHHHLISKTDLKGVITYANHSFVAVSGYQYDELLGKPHNMIRHPDMPPDAFQDLWDTLRVGKPWLGVVKNRRKDGGFYWVLASVTPIVEDGQVTGYASVRVRPSAAQVEAAQALYDRINAGRLRGYRLRQGRLAPVGWRRWLQAARLPFRPGLRAGLLRLSIISLLLVAGASALAFSAGLPDTQKWWLGGALAAGAVFMLAYGWRLAQSVLSPLEDAAGIARQMAAGNLRVQMNTQARGEIGELYFYLDLMRNSLGSAMASVETSVKAVTQTADTVNTSNTRLSGRTDQQTQSLQRTVSDMDALSATVKRNAEHALQAAELADVSMRTAHQGGKAVDDVEQTMQQIHASSSKVTDIVTLIDTIAFQTNILALNAAVESARAGEAGRGFAVVAGEVRALAQKSAQAAREIKTLIDASTSRMAQGAKQAHDAGATMRDIVNSVQKVTVLMREISQASVEQSTGLDRISHMVGQMDAATQQNAGLVQELAGTAHTLSYQGMELRHAVGVFQSTLPVAMDMARQRAERATQRRLLLAAPQAPQA